MALEKLPKYKVTCDCDECKYAEETDFEMAETVAALLHRGWKQQNGRWYSPRCIENL